MHIRWDCSSIDCRLEGSFEWARNASLAQGQLLVIHLSNGTFQFGPQTLDDTFVVSEIHLVSNAGATLRSYDMSAPYMLQVKASAPRLRLRGLTLRSRIVVAGGSVDADNCTFEGISTLEDGGAVAVMSGSLSARSSSFVSNRAIKGGAISVSSGAASLKSCRISHNVAEQDGGGLHVSGGTIRLGEGTLIESNSATTQSASFYIHNAADARYSLPAPPGRWIFVDVDADYQQLSVSRNDDYPFPCARALKRRPACAYPTYKFTHHNHLDTLCSRDRCTGTLWQWQ
jgi:hypothetical protein